jgi:hypothetical protein
MRLSFRRHVLGCAPIWLLLQYRNCVAEFIAAVIVTDSIELLCDNNGGENVPLGTGQIYTMRGRPEASQTQYISSSHMARAKQMSA